MEALESGDPTGDETETSDTTTDAPADTTTDAPADTTTDAPADTTTDAPADTTTDAPADTTADAPADTTTDAPKDILTGTPEPTEGSACDHANTEYTVGPLRDAGESLSGFTITSDGHVYDGPGAQYGVCPDCGQQICQPLDQDVHIEGAHTPGESGACTVCGYSGSCQHASQSTVRTVTGSEAQALEDGRSHLVTGAYTEQTVCDDCGAILQTVQGELETVEAHDYSENTCTVCGYEKGCRHSEVNSFIESEGAPVFVDEVDHRYEGSGCVVDVCAICGEEVSRFEFPNGLYTSHTFGEGGRCVDCGYVGACDHPDLELVLQPADSSDIAAHVVGHDEWEHFYVGPAVQCGYCEACESQIVIAVEGDMELSLSHRYVDGVCADCGYASTCEHPLDAWETSYYRGENSEAVFLSVSTHRISNGYIEDVWCTQCGAQLKNIVHETGSVDAPHSFYEGYCRICDYANVCPHPNQVWNYVLDYTREDEFTYASVSSNWHDVTGPGYAYSQCPDCGEGLERSQIVTERQAHDFDMNGLCTKCSYCIDCAHPESARETVYDVEGDCLPLDAQHHTYTGPYTATVYCRECGVALSVTSGSGTLTLDHAFDEGGVCTLCGERNTCAHENAERWSDVEWDAMPMYVSHMYHKVTGARYLYGYCPDCGQELPRELIEARVTAREHHSLDENGVCYACGAQIECLHFALCENLQFDYASAVCSDYDDVHHQVTARLVKETYCPACDKVLSSEYVSTETVLDVHLYDEEGVCRVCGHVSPVTGCSHSNVQIEPYMEPLWVDSGSASGHIAHGYEREIRICLDCGAVFFGGSSSEIVARAEEHNLVDGFCSQCGYGSLCIHSSTYADEYAVVIGVTRVANGYHEYLLAECTAEICWTCGAEIRQRVTGYTSWREPHEMDYGVCSVCAYYAPVSVTSLTIGSKLTMGVGAKTQLQPVVKPANATNPITYSSSKTSVATVDASGVVTAKKAGTATITVKCGSKTAKVTVTVKKAPTSVSISPAKATLSVGQTGTCKYTLSSGSAGTVSFSSSDPSVATVNEKGVVTAVGVGVADITVKTHNGKKASATITVVAAPTSVTLDASEIALGVGQTGALKAAADAPATITYKSLNPSIAAVDANGRVTAMGVGSATIVARAQNGVAALCTVTVKAAPSKVTLDVTKLTLGVGQTYKVDVTLGEEGEDCMGSYSFSSSKTSVATVSSSGVITAKKTGTATITVKTHNGKAAKVTVTVKKAPSSVKLSPARATLGVGETATYRYTLTSGAAASVTFTSSNEAVATVTDSGAVTAVGEGTATITVKTHNGKKATSTLTVMAAPTSVSLSASELTLGAGQTATLTASVNEGSAGAITFSSENPEIASVSGDKVTAVAVGTATIVARSYNGKEALCTVTVKAAPSKVTLDVTKLTLGVGQTYKVDVTLGEEGEDCMGSYSFSSSKTSVATVSASGVITAKKAGTATITVKTHNGKTAKVTVTVKKAPSSIKLSPTKATLTVGETATYKYTLTSGAAAGVTFTSSDETVATVTDAGVVTAVGEGTATITVKTHNGKKATSTLTVEPAAETELP